jgi:hypothetical protein
MKTSTKFVEYRATGRRDFERAEHEGYAGNLAR